MQYRIRDLYWEMRLQTGSRYDKIGFNQKLKGDGMMESYMQMLAKRSKDASRSAAKLGTADKNRGLLAVADELVAEQQLILDANAKDIEAAKKKGVKQSLIDRLELSERRIGGRGSLDEDETERSQDRTEKSAAGSGRDHL